jgi:hypothetical protein
VDAKIDYLSWSVMVDVRGAGDDQAQVDAVIDALHTRHCYFFEQFVEALAWQTGAARGHYSRSFYNPETYAVIRFGGTANHILVELPGTACQWLRDNAKVETVVMEAADRLTRLDLAVDIPGGCSPREFVQSGYNERFKSYAEIVSESGETEYVGSMKSERYSRVYKYASPHPRAGILRVEHVLRSDFAKAAALVLQEIGLLGLSAKCGETFGWRSADWKPDMLTDGKLKAKRADRHEPGRVRWLHQVCFPSLVKAHREGLIDLRQMCADLLQAI